MRNEPGAEKPPRREPSGMSEPTAPAPTPWLFIYVTFASAIVIAGVIIYLGINGYIGTYIPGSP